MKRKKMTDKQFKERVATVLRAELDEPERWHYISANVPKRDIELTEAANFEDPRSFIGKRMHPETDHHCLYVRGDDVATVRSAIYARDGGRCTLKLKCDGSRVLPFDGSIYERWHLEHKIGGLGLQRCFCPENVRGACWDCHQVKDGRQPRWTNRA